MSTLPFSANFATVYAALVQIKSADLNSIRVLLGEIKTFVEAGEWTKPALAAYVHALATTDRDGRVRNYWGPEGYEMGPAIQRVYEHDEQESHVGTYGPATLNMGLRTQLDANIEISSLADTNENHARHKIIVKAAATSSQGINVSRNALHYDADNLCVVFEFRLNMDTIGSNGMDIFFGLSPGVNRSVPGTARSAGFLKTASDTNWHMTVADGTTQTTPVDTGVPPVANTYQTFRFEYHGANTPVGVDNSTVPVARFFIDGAFEGEIADANVPTTADGSLRLDIVVGENSPGGDVFVDFGPIRYAYNQVIDGDIPA